MREKYLIRNSFMDGWGSSKITKYFHFCVGVKMLGDAKKRLFLFIVQSFFSETKVSCCLLDAR